MKKVSLFILCVILVISVFSVATFATDTENKTEEGLYLTTIEALSATGYVDPIMDTEGTIRYVDGDFKYPHSIEAHPKTDSEPSYVEYDISSYDYTHFSAYLGKNADLSAAGMHVVFVVWADSEKIFESEPVAIGDAPVACVANIPKDTKKLKLEVNSGTDGVGYDTSTWGSPMLTNLTVTGLKESRKVSKTEYKIGEEFAANGGFYAITYSNEMEVVKMLDASMVTGFDSTSAGKKTLTVTFEGKTYTFDVTVAENATPTPTKTDTATPDKTDKNGTSSTGKDDNPGLIIGIIAGVVVVIVVIAVIILNNKKKKVS